MELSWTWVSYQYERLTIQYALKLKSIPKHPAHKSIFQPKYSTKFADKPSAIPTFGIRINKLLQDIPIIELSDIADDQKPEPVWTINQPVIRLDLRVGIKREIHPTNFMSRFDNFHCTYDHCDFIYTDGSKTEYAVGCAALMLPSRSICLQHPRSTQLNFEPLY